MGPKWIILAIGLVSAALAAGGSFHRSRPASPGALARDDAWTVPGFAMTDQDARPFASQQLAGKVWVADFVFTGCAASCPRLTARMSQLQQQFPDPRLHFVSIDVDPNDNQAKLKKYAAANAADESRWHFLTPTSRPALFALAKAVKITTAADDRDFQLLHSDCFFLMDGHGHVQGAYDSNDSARLQQLTSDLAALLTQEFQSSR